VETLKSLVDWLDDIVEDESIESAYIRWINSAIEQVAKMYPWDTLRREYSATVSGGSLQLPPLLGSINQMWEDLDEVVPTAQFTRRDDRPRASDMRSRQRWYRPNGSKLTAGTTYSNTSVANGSQTVTGTVPNTGDVGKGVMFAGYPGVHEILTADGSTMTMYPKFPGTDSSTQSFEVDGAGYRQLMLYTEADAAFSGDIVLSYQMAHPILGHDDDVVLFDAPETLRLMALQQAHRQNKYDVDAERLRVDIEIAKQNEIPYPENTEEMTDYPRGLAGQPPLFAGQSRKFASAGGWADNGGR